MRKIITNFLTVLAVFLVMMPVVYATSNFASINIQSGTKNVRTSEVGVSLKCDYVFMNYDTSKSTLQGSLEACWTGWPYTTEVRVNMKPGYKVQNTETQSKNSCFRGNLISSNKTENGYVSVHAR